MMNGTSTASDARPDGTATTVSGPDDMFGMLARAEACYLRGDRRGAAIVYAQAIAAMPYVAELYGILGSLLFDLGGIDGTVTACRQAIMLRPDYADAYYGLGNGLRARADRAAGDAATDGDPLAAADTDRARAAAAAAYRRALALGAASAELFNNLGVIEASRGAFARAVAAYRNALVLQPDYAGACYNLGNVLYASGGTAAAVDTFRRTVTMTPDDADTLNNLGSVLRAQGRLDDAIRTYDQALARGPEDPRIHVNRAMALLHRGRLAEGWADYEWRWKTRLFRDFVIDDPRPAWQGEPLAGQTILLYGEQGFGDALQFVRFAPVLAAQGARVVLQVRRPLVRLLGTVPDVAAIVAMDAPRPPFDCHCALMSVPRVLRTGLADIPADVPYLSASPAAVAAWRQRLSPLPGLKVGLVWSGDPLPSDRGSTLPDRRRSIPAAGLGGLAGLSGVSFISLQKDPASGRAGDLPAGLRLYDWMNEIGDFADTAALVSALDLVVTVDTAMAHLAGALGRPVWILIRHDACWRWLQGREDSPWYPTARLFRQAQPDAWDMVVERVGRELTRWAAVLPGGRAGR